MFKLKEKLCDAMPSIVDSYSDNRKKEDIVKTKHNPEIATSALTQKEKLLFSDETWHFKVYNVNIFVLKCNLAQSCYPNVKFKILSETGIFFSRTLLINVSGLREEVNKFISILR